MHRQEGEWGRRLSARALPGALTGGRSAGHLAQVLSQEEYACWLKGHLEAESSVDNREELLFQSAIRLETDLHLLGEYAQSARCVGGVRACGDGPRAGGDLTLGSRGVSACAGWLKEPPEARRALRWDRP